MKTTFVTLALLIGLFTHSFALRITPAKPKADTAAYTVTVVISDVTKRTGKLYIGLATNESTFTGQSAKTQAVDVSATGDITITFDKLPAGRYAIRAYQDLNDNQKMDFLGQMPSEPFGFSNVTMLMGPPSFDQCSFELSASKLIQLKMIEM
ncbi:DUF2141 domain-containing protein [Spirosoma agri]|uniref:DUF2141 domain-containing protein n=1 Tax=Spirosoma agri TaxID=1987381 RepID=A0A6M0IC33_9BACT|nr:DUF2141 domain-containing protein [Spirosoma agri]NEU65305.1 DUF2141 domain-containing protein [Spirosoma agri]